MTLKDVLIMSANLLNLPECETLESINEENYTEVLESNKSIKKLFNLAITSLREICLNYLPIVVEVDVRAVDKKIETNTLEDFVKLVKVKLNDKPVSYKFKNGTINVKNDEVYTVQYVQNPKVSKITDSLEIFEELSPDILVLGICSYYAISMGMYDEFEYYHEEYLKRAESIKKLGIYQMPSRRWL